MDERAIRNREILRSINRIFKVVAKVGQRFFDCDFVVALENEIESLRHHFLFRFETEQPD